MLTTRILPCFLQSKKRRGGRKSTAPEDAGAAPADAGVPIGETTTAAAADEPAAGRATKRPRGGKPPLPSGKAGAPKKAATQVQPVTEVAPEPARTDVEEPAEEAPAHVDGDQAPAEEEELEAFAAALEEEEAAVAAAAAAAEEEEKHKHLSRKQRALLKLGL